MYTKYKHSIHTLELQTTNMVIFGGPLKISNALQLVWYSVNCNDQHLHNRFVWYAGPHPTPQWNQAVCNLDVKQKNMSIFADGVVHFVVWNKVSWSYCSFSALISELMFLHIFRVLSIHPDPHQGLNKVLAWVLTWKGVFHIAKYSGSEPIHFFAYSMWWKWRAGFMPRDKLWWMIA